VETSANKAVDHARIFRPDLIFMDIKMPGPDGFALARELRQQAWLCHRPIIFYSGLVNVEELALKAGLGGPTQFLPKGVPLSVIEQTVRRFTAERLDFSKRALTPGPRRTSWNGH
jgi:CheY-like chemotaxis protein